MFSAFKRKPPTSLGPSYGQDQSDDNGTASHLETLKALQTTAFSDRLSRQQTEKLLLDLTHELGELAAKPYAKWQAGNSLSRLMTNDKEEYERYLHLAECTRNVRSYMLPKKYDSVRISALDSLSKAKASTAGNDKIGKIEIELVERVAFAGIVLGCNQDLESINLPADSTASNTYFEGLRWRQHSQLSSDTRVKMDDTVLGTMLASEALEAEYNAKSNVSGIQGGSRVEESQGRQEMVEVKDKGKGEEEVGLDLWDMPNPKRRLHSTQDTTEDGGEEDSSQFGKTKWYGLDD